MKLSHPLLHSLAFIRAAVIFTAFILAPDKSVCGATVPARGVVLFTRPPATYPELLNYVSLAKTSVVFTLVIQTDGRRVEIPNNGILGVFEYPPQQPDATTEQRGSLITAQIDAALAKYPRAEYREIHGKLLPLATAWRTLQQLAATMPRQAKSKPSVALPSPSPQHGPTISTLDGTIYEGVQITKVDPDALSIVHSAGVAILDFENLPADLRRKYNYDPRLAIPAREARRQTSAAASAALAAANQRGNDTPANFTLKRLADDPPGNPNPLVEHTPSFEGTIDFINSKIRGHQQRIWFGANSRKMLVSYGAFSQIVAFEPSKMVATVKVEVITNATIGLAQAWVRMECIGGSDATEVIAADGKRTKGSSFAVELDDPTDKDRVASACQHLLEISGAKREAF